MARNGRVLRRNVCKDSRSVFFTVKPNRINALAGINRGYCNKWCVRLHTACVTETLHSCWPHALEAWCEQQRRAKVESIKQHRLFLSPSLWVFIRFRLILWALNKRCRGSWTQLMFRNLLEHKFKFSIKVNSTRTNFLTELKPKLACECQIMTFCRPGHIIFNFP